MTAAFLDAVAWTLTGFVLLSLIAVIVAVIREIRRVWE